MPIHHLSVVVITGGGAGAGGSRRAFVPVQVLCPLPVSRILLLLVSLLTDPRPLRPPPAHFLPAPPLGPLHLFVFILMLVHPRRLQLPPPLCPSLLLISHPADPS